MFRFLRNRTGALLFLCFIVVGIGYAVRYLYQAQVSLEKFDEPTFLVLRLEGIPLLRENGRPLDAMAGSEVEITCDRVSPKTGKGKAKFRFDFGGAPFEADDCDVKHTLVGQPGEIKVLNAQMIVVDPGGAERVVDRYLSEVRLIPSGESLKLRGFETPDGRPVGTLTVPKAVVPFVEAALKLDGLPEDYTALFFVQRPGRSDWMLSVRVPETGGQTLEAVRGPVQRFRRFGAELAGYAAWPPGPISIGNPEDVREMFEVTAGLFRVADLPDLVSKCCRHDATSGITTVSGLDLEALRAKALHGLMAPPLRLVRAPGPGSATAIMPSAPAQSPDHRPAD